MFTIEYWKIIFSFLHERENEWITRFSGRWLTSDTGSGGGRGESRRRPRSSFQILVFSSTRARPWAAVSKYSGGLEGRRSNYTHGYPPPCGSANFFYDKPVALRGERCFVTAGRTRSAANPLGRPADTRSGSPRQCANSRRLPFQHLFFTRSLYFSF